MTPWLQSYSEGARKQSHLVKYRDRGIWEGAMWEREKGNWFRYARSGREEMGEKYRVKSSSGEVCACMYSCICTHMPWYVVEVMEQFSGVHFSEMTSEMVNGGSH